MNKNPEKDFGTQVPSTAGHCMPDRQKFAQAFLDGRVPAVMDQIAPDARTGPGGEAGWQESDETVERLRQWREEAPYG